jgi:hypothetical protein
VKKTFILTAALVGALLLAGCENGTGGDTGTDDNNNNGETANTRLKVQNESSFTLVDVKWSNITVFDSLDSAQSATVDVAEGSGYLYFTKVTRGGWSGLECRTQEVIAVSKEETKELVITNNTIVVAVDDTDNVQALGTIVARVTQLKVQNESSFTLADLKWSNITVSDILDSAQSETVDVAEGSGYLYFTKGGSSGLKCRTQEAIAVSKNETKELVITNNTIVVAVDDTDNVQALGTIAERVTQLTVNNQSFTELTDVIWNNVSFANNTVENSVKTGTSVTEPVSEGSGYIFFKRKSSPITARTKNLVAIAKLANETVTFTDATEIVEVNNPDNTGTLGALASTVIWWDDAEGEMPPYYERLPFAGYYKTYSDFGNYSSSYYRFFPPKNGQKSIAVGGSSTTAKLHLRITLGKAAKLSFWYANNGGYNTAGGATFSINGTVQRTWATDVDWSKLEFDLTTGTNDLVWEKKDGLSSYYYYFLTLDDILIYYTE